MQAWPRNAALTLLLIALALLAVFQWLPALLLFPAAGALLVWNQAPPTGQRRGEY
ncbi:MULTISPECIES: hypothetical protein [Glutamicibacter]|uniref:hypothetical protein n=1 Tax=Glutamicibacter TaxID=1742989 RepID=UPI0014851281|nr:hypothetical protein [Glutamicibacter sp. V16R2B1]